MEYAIPSLAIVAALIWGCNQYDRRKKAEREVDRMRSRRLDDGIKAIYAKEGIRKITEKEMDALMNNEHPVQR